MLTHSPVAHSPSLTSQQVCHHAPAFSPPHSQCRSSVASPRPLSHSNVTSPAHTRTTRHVGVDASTQYSPKEPFDYWAGKRLPQLPPGDTHHLTAVSFRPSVTAQAPQDPLQAAADKGSFLLHGSPTTRRSSQLVPDYDASESTSAFAEQPKWPTPDDTPAKVLPLRYELCPVEDMVVLIAHMLGELIETNDHLALKSGQLTRFHSRTTPAISVVDYLHRLAKHATLTPPLLLSMVYYIDRLCAMSSDFTINSLTVHRFLITAATVAAKGLSDAFWNNSTYARVGGVRVAELKMLELEFLHRVDWRIVPSPDVLIAYYKGLVERCIGYALKQEPEPSDTLNKRNEHEEETSETIDETDTWDRQLQSECECDDAAENSIIIGQ